MWIWWLLFSASAQVAENADTPNINAQVFRPTIDGTRTLWTDDATRGPHNQAMARFLLHYTDDPLVYERDDGEVIGLVENVVQGDLMAAYAYDRLRVGVDVPVYFFAAGDAGSEGGLGDLALDAKVTVLDGEDAPLNLGANGRVTLPTHTVQAALGDPNVGWELAAIADRSFGPVLLAANLGIRGGPATEFENLSLNDSFVYRTAIGYEIVEDAGISAEVAGRVTFIGGAVGAGSPADWLLGGYGYATDDVTVRGGFGSGFTPGVGAPDFRLMLGIGYEPRGPKAPKDTDLDGITDDIDACIEEPEDIDSFEDTDGCPDIDNDADGILDVADKCPLKPEDKDGWKDEEGCPDPNTEVTLTIVDQDGQPIDLAKGTLRRGKDVLVRGSGNIEQKLQPGTYFLDGVAGTYTANELTFEVINGPPQEFTLKLEKQKNVKIVVSRDRIDLKDTINFETAKAVIKSDSYDLLDQAVKILEDYPEIRLLRIEGHTDSRGSASYNLDLSKKRAASVMEYFIEQGSIEAERLTSEGFGEERPLDPAKTKDAYAKNRRVDFFIVEWDESRGQQTIEIIPGEQGETE